MEAPGLDGVGPGGFSHTGGTFWDPPPGGCIPGADMSCAPGQTASPPQPGAHAPIRSTLEPAASAHEGLFPCCWSAVYLPHGARRASDTSGTQQHGQAGSVSMPVPWRSSIIWQVRALCSLEEMLSGGRCLPLETTVSIFWVGWFLNAPASLCPDPTGARPYERPLGEDWLVLTALIPVPAARNICTPLGVCTHVHTRVHGERAVMVGSWMDTGGRCGRRFYTWPP